MSEIIANKLAEKNKFFRSLVLNKELQDIHWGPTPSRNSYQMMLLTDIVCIDIDNDNAIDEFMNVYQITRKQFDDFKDFEK